MTTDNSNSEHINITNSSIFNTMVSQYYDWVLELNTDNGSINFLHVSNAFLERGIIPDKIKSFDELSQHFAEEMVVPEEYCAFQEQVNLPYILRETSSKGNYVRTIHITTSDGIRAESLRITPIKDNASYYLACLTDISMILDRDWMTDEYSRSGFISKVEQLLKDPQYQNGYSVVYINIQAFKAINDILGPQNSDMIIFSTRAKILEELDPVLIARLESDHFAAFTKTENITDEKLNRLCHQCYIKETKRLSYQLRCGIYNIYNHTKTVAHMLDRAKIAEKSIPGNQKIPYAICNEQLSQDYVNERIYVSELDSALKKGEFEAYYQPIVDAKTYEIVSAEALIRWNHSERGLIPPGKFIPVFEQEGLTSKLASFMINSILDFNLQQMDIGKKSIPCSVNLSRVLSQVTV